MNNETKISQPAENLQTIAVLNFLLISLMLSCFASIFGRSIKIYNPSWVSTGFQAMAFFVAFESLFRRYYQRKESRLSQNMILGTIAEIFLIFLISKILSMFHNGFSTLWNQISSWQEDFIANFFNADSLFFIFGIFLIWMIAWLFSQPLIQLEEDHDLMEQEKLGFVFTDRRQARRNLINLIFVIGFAMILMASLINYFFDTQIINQELSQNLLTILIIYFSAGFVFLSINQYAIMKAYWYFNDISVNPDLVKRWVFYAILFIFFVVILILFIPNDFTIGFDPFIQIIVQLFIYLITLIQFIIIFPIVLLITLVTSLFSNEPIQDQLQDQVQEYAPIAPGITGQSPWLEVIKSILFWLVFIAIIIFTIRFYIKNNLYIKSLFKSFHFSGWLKDFWKWIKESLFNFKRIASTKYKEGIENIRIFLRERQSKFPKLSSVIRKIPPRENIIMIYLDWIHWNNQSGIKRKESQTPLEFAQSCSKFYYETSGSLNAFTDSFIAARYSDHPINEEQAQEAKRLFEKLKKAFEQAQENQEINYGKKS
jgi:hypothetical protein